MKFMSAEYIKPHIDKLHTRLEDLKLNVLAQAREDNRILEYDVVPFEIVYDPEGRDWHFPNEAIDMWALLEGNLLELANEIAKDFDARIVRMLEAESNEVVQDERELPAESAVFKKTLH